MPDFRREDPKPLTQATPFTPPMGATPMASIWELTRFGIMEVMCGGCKKLTGIYSALDAGYGTFSCANCRFPPVGERPGPGGW